MARAAKAAAPPREKTLRELFAADITREIPAVVYFHEHSPEKLEAEVREYIITGGTLELDADVPRTSPGIHEEFVRLLRGLSRALATKGGPALPAAWISGFYGSGKSSFAKLVGLSLDGARLPDGTPLARALLERDASPLRQELVTAWDALVEQIDPIAVVFDAGSTARDNEDLHAMIARAVQGRLGYCSKSQLVADFELRLERDGEWEAFERRALQTLRKAWSVAKEEDQAEEHFSHVLHRLRPERYPEPTSWLRSRASHASAGASVREVVDAIDAMLARRAAKRTLFIVVDEVSQFVGEDESRMLKLQSLVSELGQRLKGRAFLFATGQQRLEDSAETRTLAKLKDRFPSELRVHLGAASIRDVVHERLLKKSPTGAEAVRALFNQGSNRATLKLHGYACEALREQDFVEAYPLLPGHFDLLLQITSSLRARAAGTSETPAIRGVLQLLGELFRGHALADRELGVLVTLDAIYDVLCAALDAEVRATVARIGHELRDDALAQQAAKAVALLELIQEETATTPELVARCLYARLGAGNRVKEVALALEKLCASNLLSYSERHGFRVQSAAGEAWQRERDDVGVTDEELGRVIAEALESLVSRAELPRWKGRTFQFSLGTSDERRRAPRPKDAREASPVSLDFRFIADAEERSPAIWVPRSAQEPLSSRLVWIARASASIDGVARKLVRSERMLSRHRPRRESLNAKKQRLLAEEGARFDELVRRLHGNLAEALQEGTVFFRGQPLKPAAAGPSFGAALTGLATRVLPDLYTHFCEVAVSPREIEQLLDRELSGPPAKFMAHGLGILTLDAGRYLAACTGLVPTRIAETVERRPGISGHVLIASYADPPYGYAPELVKACAAGLLRARRLRIQSASGAEILTPLDPGVRDLFMNEQDFRHAEFFPASAAEITGKDRIALRKLFQKYLGVDQEPEDEALADSAFEHFPAVRERLAALEGRYRALPGAPELPLELQKFGRALEDCRRSRLVLDTVLELKRQLEVLREGFERFARDDAALPPLTAEPASMTTIETGLLGREVSSREELDALLTELAARIAPHLGSGSRVRLR